MSVPVITLNMQLEYLLRLSMYVLERAPNSFPKKHHMSLKRVEEIFLFQLDFLEQMVDEYSRKNAINIIRECIHQSIKKYENHQEQEAQKIMSQLRDFLIDLSKGLEGKV